MDQNSKSRTIPALITLASIAGIIFSILALRSHIRSEVGLSSFCNINAEFNCDAVNSSAWSTILGIPLAEIGIIFYTVLACLGLASFSAWRRSNMCVLFAISFFATIYSIFLFYIQKFEIKAFCIICIAMYIVNLTVFVLSWFDLRGVGFFSTINQAIKSATHYPLTLLGVGTYRGTSAASLALFGFILTLGMAGLAAWLPVMFLPENSEVSADMLARNERMAVDSWRSARPYTIERNEKTDIVIGSRNPTVQIVEYLDFQCPSCRALYPEMHGLVAQAPDKIQLVIRNYPLNPECNASMERDGHPSACDAAKFSVCALEQGKGPEAADYLFNLQALDAGGSREAVKEAILKGVDILNLDASKFGRCFESGQTVALLKETIVDAEHLNLMGTPSVFINGRTVDSPSKTVLTSILDELL